MSIPTIHDASLQGAQLRAASLMKGEPYESLPTQSLIAAIAKHGGMYTLLDPDLTTARMAAFTDDKKSSRAFAEKLHESATSYFYKLVDKPGYTIHSELMAYLSEPGTGNGVSYNTGIQPSPDIPAAFTFVGQFIDHDLTFNGMNLTENENGVLVQDQASPTIDLDSVYGPRANVTKPVYKRVFDDTGRFIHREIKDDSGKVVGYDVPRHDNKHDPNNGVAYIFDPRNDENQLILQIHILVERLHNKLIDAGFPEKELGSAYKTAKVQDIINCVRKEVVATWQSFILNEFMPKVILQDVLAFVLAEIKESATPGKPQAQYGSMKHKPYLNLVTGKNVVRMPHEFAIGFRYGHSQLRPMYLLNSYAPYVLLFKDARLSKTVRVDLPKGYPVPYIDVDGTDDLHGHRPLMANHVIEWKVFYPSSNDLKAQVESHSLLIDHNITARVFNLPESAIPDDIKYIGNLIHRNLIRSSQIGIVSGEELAEFYDIDVLPQKFILGNVDVETEDRLRTLFEMDGKSEHGHKPFKTPLWYYLLKEAEYYGEKDPAQLGKLGKVGSRLVAEVLAGAIYYDNEYGFSDTWESFIPSVDNKVMLTDILKFVGDEIAAPASA